jgi:hypothetical protein
MTPPTPRYRLVLAQRLADRYRSLTAGQVQQIRALYHKRGTRGYKSRTNGELALAHRFGVPRELIQVPSPIALSYPRTGKLG